MQAEQLVSSEEHTNLLSRWETLKQKQPTMRIRDAATALKVSELELLLIDAGQSVTRLKPEWADIVNALQGLGEVMALTRNDSAVHEKTGVYNNVRIMGEMGLVLDEKIDLRLFLSKWCYGFAVSSNTDKSPRPSLQFFDECGTAIHKIYLTENSNAAAYESLVEKYCDAEPATQIDVEPLKEKPGERAVESDEVERFRSAWRALQDTHDFFDLLKNYELTRTQALRLGGPEFARQTSPEVFGEFMQSLATESLSIMVFVGSPGVVQIHTGPIFQLRTMGPWFNVLDDDFNLHLREDMIDSAWVVRKPTVDGDVTSLELYNVNGEVIAYLFGARKPGQAENLAWRKKVNALPLLEESA